MGMGAPLILIAILMAQARNLMARKISKSTAKAKSPILVHLTKLFLGYQHHNEIIVIFLLRKRKRGINYFFEKRNKK